MIPVLDTFCLKALFSELNVLLNFKSSSFNHYRCPSRVEEPESGVISSVISEQPQGCSTPKAAIKSESAQPFTRAKDVEKISSQFCQKFSKEINEDSSDSGEVISIESGSGSRVKLPIPGTSNSVTINFPADVLEQVLYSNHLKFGQARELNGDIFTWH